MLSEADDVQQNAAWLGRFFLLMCPQDEQVCEVYAGSTYTSGTPARAGMYGPAGAR